MPDIASLREKLGVPANRTLPDGTPYHTLPVIKDSSKGEVIGDTFEIALYLDRAYPDYPSLFRPHTTGLTAAFNAYVDGVFTKHVALCTQLPFDPRVEKAAKAMFAKRAGVESLDDLQLSNEQREQTLVSFEAALGELAKAYHHTGGTTDHVWRAGGTDHAQKQRPPPGREQAAPFLDGEGPAYADFIVGAWLKSMAESLPKEEWERVRKWQDGLWARLADALDTWSKIK
jgi:glutathione S-transferase